MNAAIATRAGTLLAALLPIPALASGQVNSSAVKQTSLRAESVHGLNTIGSTERRTIEQATPLTEEDLARNRGGQTVVAGSQTLTAVTTGNVLNGNYMAGSVVLSDQALSNFNGIGNFAINTGAQVSIQSGMNLTINVAP